MTILPGLLLYQCNLVEPSGAFLDQEVPGKVPTPTPLFSSECLQWQPQWEIESATTKTHLNGVSLNSLL